MRVGTRVGLKYYPSQQRVSSICVHTFACTYVLLSNVLIEAERFALSNKADK